MVKYSKETIKSIKGVLGKTINIFNLNPDKIRIRLEKKYDSANYLMKQRILNGNTMTTTERQQHELVMNAYSQFMEDYNKSLNFKK